MVNAEGRNGGLLGKITSIAILIVAITLALVAYQPEASIQTKTTSCGSGLTGALCDYLRQRRCFRRNEKPLGEYATLTSGAAPKKIVLSSHVLLSYRCR